MLNKLKSMKRNDNQIYIYMVKLKDISIIN